MRKMRRLMILGAAVVLLATSCSLSQLATRAMVGALTSGSGASTFTSDNDPQLVADALPFALKLYETLLPSDPTNRALITTTGSGFIMYANAFVQTPAMELPSSQFDKANAMKIRAKKLYLRGRDILLAGLERLHPGFLKELNGDQYALALKGMTKADVPLLYWAAAGWMGAYALDTFDFALGLTIKRANVLMEKALALEPDFNDGAIHEFYIQYYGALPASMGGSRTKAREQYDLALKVSKGKLASPYVAYATAIDIPTQNLAEFTELMKKALAINPDAMPDTRLQNIISQQEAQWYMAHLDQFFISAPPNGDNNATNNQ